MSGLHIEDRRSRRIVLVSHCVLNANAKVEGLSLYQGVHPLVAELAARGVGVIQMPCAEMGACGMKRWGQTREQYANPAFEELCASLADDTARLVREYQRCGYDVLGVVGIEGSPTCGVTKSAAGDWGGEPGDWNALVARSATTAQPGIHMEALMERLAPLGITFTAIDESVDGHRTDGVLRDLFGEPQSR